MLAHHPFCPLLRGGEECQLAPEEEVMKKGNVTKHKRATATQGWHAAQESRQPGSERSLLLFPPLRKDQAQLSRLLLYLPQ